MPPTTWRRRLCWRRGGSGASCASPRVSSRGCRPSPATSAADGRAGAGASCPRHRSAPRHSSSRGPRSTSKQSSNGPRWPSWWTWHWVHFRRPPARPCASATWTTGALRRSPIAPAARPTRSRCASPEARPICAVRWRATCVRRRSRSGSCRPLTTAGCTRACTARSAGWARSSCASSRLRARSHSGARAATRTRPLGPWSSRSPIQSSPPCWRGWCARPPSCGGPTSGRTRTTATGWRPATSRVRDAATGCPFRPTSATTCPSAATAAGSTPTAPTARSRSPPR